MKQICLIRILFFILISGIPPMLFAQQTPYQKGWEAMNRGDHKQAWELFAQAAKDPAYARDANLTCMLMKWYEDRGNESTAYWNQAMASIDQRDPYLYALWNHIPVAGAYGRKEKHTFTNLQNWIKDPATDLMLVSSARYQLAHHYVTLNDFKSAAQYWSGMTNVPQWQFAGPFDNYYGSGFDRAYEPITHPEGDYTFIDSRNAPVKWFTPRVMKDDGWITPTFYIPQSSSIVYAQAFVEAQEDMQAMLGLGFTGNVKVWLNDQLLVSEPEERKTDFDIFRVPCTLHKGVNRVLIQIGTINEEYASYCLRFTDPAMKKMLPLTPVKQQPYFHAEGGVPEPQPFFADRFFEQRLAGDSSNLLNYYLLAQSYTRSGLHQQARVILEQAVKRAPENPVLLILLLQNLNEGGNRTEVTRVYRLLQSVDPESKVVLSTKRYDAMATEQYEEASTLLERSVELYGEDENALEARIKLAAKQSNSEELIRLIPIAYEKYPNNFTFFNWMNNLALSVQKDPKQAIKLHESWMKRMYSPPVLESLYDLYEKTGQGSKGLKLLLELEQKFPDAIDYQYKIYDYYMGEKRYAEARQYAAKILGLRPYSSIPWNNLGVLNLIEGHKDTALKALQTSLTYNPNDYDVRRQIRTLQGKPDLLQQILTQENPATLLKQPYPKEWDKEYDFFYAQHDVSAIIYPERNFETHITLVIKILNNDGLDHWKESSIRYNAYRQHLVIEKAEVIKPNGNKLIAEINDNAIVFTNLKVGDGIVIKYKLTNYLFGFISRQFWDKYLFAGNMPIRHASYKVLYPKEMTLNTTVKNGSIPYTESAIEDFTLRTWEQRDIQPVKNDPWMPPFVDVEQALHLSNGTDWNTIANWYADVSQTQAKSGYEVDHLIQSLFGSVDAAKALPQLEQAKRLYTYITRNIRYSSVPFRQGAYVPQKASAVLQTQLGDCKDLSTLFAAAGRQIGLDINLILVNTRDNGEADIQLPSMEFNHCIVRVMIDGKPWFLELTDSHLPFGQLPQTVLDATALIIPYKSQPAEASLSRVPANFPKQGERSTFQSVTFDGQAILVKASYLAKGAIVSGMRHNYLEATTTRQSELLQERITKQFNSQVQIKNMVVDTLQTDDTFRYEATFQVSNQILRIGQLNTYKPVFLNVFVDATAFSKDTTTFPVCYWRYEDTDHYLDTVEVTPPSGMTFSEIPQMVQLSFGKTRYTLSYQVQANGRLQVIREILVDRNIIIKKEEYPAFKRFIDQILQAETTSIGMKTN